MDGGNEHVTEHDPIPDMRDVRRERRREGVEAAKARGVVFGNPVFAKRDAQAISAMKATQSETYTRRARHESRVWRDTVETSRPARSWTDILSMINHDHYQDRKPLTHGTLMRHVNRLVNCGDLPASVLERSKGPLRQSASSVAQRILRDSPDTSLRRIGRELDALGVKPVRADRWSAQTVARLLEGAA